jgi:anti-sigma factor RsiW
MSAGPTCRELVAFLDDYLAGTLDEATRSSFEAHLETCPSCVRYVATYRQSLEVARRSSALEIAGEVPDELVSAVLRLRRRAADRT